MARRGLGALLERAEPISVNGVVTIAEGARRKGVTYHSLRLWLRSNPTVPLLKIGTIVLVRTDELEKYQPIK
jgi:hypothetical protein